MKVLVLGAAGMLGHRLLLHFAERGFDVRGVLRRDEASYRAHGLFTRANCFFGVDVRDADALRRVVREFRPDAVVNAVGIVKQRDDAHKAVPSLEINALLPHRLAEIAADAGARVVQMSTDCVFSGQRGSYREDDLADARDLYGLTKYLGELREGNCITLRSSIVGPELENKMGLYEWFLAQRGPVRGFRRAVFSGFSTHEMARIIALLLARFPAARGLYHVSAEPINKYDLLCLWKSKLGLETEIVPDDAFVCDRSLDSSRFRREFSYTPPSWDAMAEEMCVQRSAQSV